MDKSANVNLKKSVLLLISTIMLLTGGLLLKRNFSSAMQTVGATKNTDEEKLSFIRLQGNSADLQGTYPVDSVDQYFFEWDGKDVFSLLLASYKDENDEQRNAVLYPNSPKGSAELPGSVGSRHRIWLEAAEAIKQNTPQDALILSWWDDGQRARFLTGRDVWVDKPAVRSFSNPVWNSLKSGMTTASDKERDRSIIMARWLTMDSEKAIKEMRKFFNQDKPIYILVSNDLLLQLAEIGKYGGTPISFSRKTFPAGGDLHGDISLIKRWTYEENAGNYLAHQEGSAYHIWGLPKASTGESNSLLVRLLPFVDSLKKLPKGIKLVYQSHWAGFLSIYQLER